MKPSYLLTLCAVLFLSNRLSANMCEDFKAAVSIEAPTTQFAIQAGKEIRIPVKIEIGKTQAARWKYINLTAGLYNQTAGSKSPFVADIISFGGSPLEIPTEFTFATTPAMGGEYQVGVSIYSQDPTYPGACVVKKDPVPNLKVEVKNLPENTDIHPPILKATKFKQSVYRAGDTLEILFRAEDKSDICTVWKEQNGTCHSGTHLELKASNSDHVISFHTPTPIFVTKDKGTYLALVPLSEEYATKEIKPGLYQLTHFMFRDIHGNTHDKVAPDLDAFAEFK